MRQLELNFVGGLTDRFETIMDVAEASIATSGRQKKAIAMDLDIQPSTFSRMFSDTDTGVNFPLAKLPALIQATGDKSIIYWLIETFLEDEDAKRRRALAELPETLARLQKLLKSVEM